VGGADSVRRLGRVPERVLVADDDLCGQHVRCRLRTVGLLDRGADGQELDEPAAEVVDVGLHAHDVVGADARRLLTYLAERLLACGVDELGELADLALDVVLERGHDAAHEAQRVDAGAQHEHQWRVADLREVPGLLCREVARRDAHPREVRV
jgi:hypothetical protein